MQTSRNTVQQLIPAIGAVVNVRFESLTVRCTVTDAKNSWGKVRLQVTPELGSGSQWIELERLVTELSDELKSYYRDTRPEWVRAELARTEEK